MDRDTERYLISVLRQASVTWSGRTACLNRGRRKRVVGTMKDGRDKTVWENNCEGCGVWRDLKDNAFEVDHIEEVGPFKNDWNDFINRIFCEQSNLQRLCVHCHLKKTSKFNATLRYQRKTPTPPVNDIDFL